MDNTMLSIDKLVVKYGKITALKGVTLTVNEGQITTLIGSNGAGKSTLLKTISGLLKPAEGSIVFNGREIAGMAAEKVVVTGITQCPEGRRIFPRQTVHENLKAGAFVRKDKKNVEGDIEKMLDMFPRLRERINQKAGTLSGGEQQMLAICRALMSKPKLLMLDEPSMGLSPLLVEEVFQTIKRIHREGTTILLIEQNATQALKIADMGYVIENGRIIFHDTAENLLGNDTVKNAYLGIG